MTTIETLKAARNLISIPDRWTKRGYAREKNGMPEIDANSEGAGCWCSTGAIACIQNRDIPIFTSDMEDAFGMDDINLENFNDAPERTHAEVLAAFDEAISRLESSDAK